VGRGRRFYEDVLKHPEKMPAGLKGFELILNAPYQAWALATGADMQERTYLKDSSQRSYRDILKNYLVPEFGHLLITQITEAKVAKLQAIMRVGSTMPAN